METITIQTEFIKLDSFLKFCGACGTGAVIDCKLDIDEMVAPMVAPGSPIDSFCLN